jgi:formiminotetrahydrofolate cyclodeaminase
VAAKAGVLENVNINLESITDAAFKAMVQQRLSALITPG